MNKGFFLSLILHIGIIYALIYGLPDIGRHIEDLELPISFDVIAAETLTPNPAPKRVELKDQSKPTLKPIPKPELKPQEKQEEIITELEKEKTPAPEFKPQIVEDAPSPEPVPPPLPDDKKITKVPDRTVPIPRSKPSVTRKQEQTEKKEEEHFTSILKDLKKLKTSQPKGQEELQDDPDEEGGVGKQGEILTISEIDAVRSQLSKCWNVPAGARDAKDLKVKVHLWMNGDGSVSKAKIIKDPFLQTHPFYKVAADRALNAVLDKNCNPLPLPKEKYALWKEMIITFDPKEILG